MNIKRRKLRMVLKALRGMSKKHKAKFNSQHIVYDAHAVYLRYIGKSPNKWFTKYAHGFQEWVSLKFGISEAEAEFLFNGRDVKVERY